MTSPALLNRLFVLGDDYFGQLLPDAVVFEKKAIATIAAPEKCADVINLTVRIFKQRKNSKNMKNLTNR